MSADFSCLACGAEIPDETMRQRLTDPPGRCSECGGRHISEDRDGALAEIAGKLGVRYAHLGAK